MRTLFALLFACSVAACMDSGTSGDDQPEQQQCLEVRDHLVDLRLAGTASPDGENGDVNQYSPAKAEG